MVMHDLAEGCSEGCPGSIKAGRRTGDQSATFRETTYLAPIQGPAPSAGPRSIRGRARARRGSRPPGDYRRLAIPVPIPNTVVKQASPMIVRKRESRSSPGLHNAAPAAPELRGPRLWWAASLVGRVFGGPHLWWAVSLLGRIFAGPYLCWAVSFLGRIERRECCNFLTRGRAGSAGAPGPGYRRCLEGSSRRALLVALARGRRIHLVRRPRTRA